MEMRESRSFYDRLVFIGRRNHDIYVTADGLDRDAWNEFGKSSVWTYYADAQLIKADNVWEYEWDRISQTPDMIHHEEWEFSCLISPYEEIFIEFDNVTVIDDSGGAEATCGVYIGCSDNRDKHEGWTLTIAVFMVFDFNGYRDEDIWEVGTCVIGLDEFGKPDWWDGVVFDLGGHSYCRFKNILYPALKTIEFLNAKNTELIDNPPPAKLSKHHEKKYGVPLVTYKTLKVNSINKVNANEYDDDSDGDSIPKSLHIVRGNFADYRNGPGLFGKHQDIFWRPAHVRGSAKQGVVVKDYDVQAPEA